MPIRPKDGFGSNLPVAVHLCERPESALCSRWATTLGMGEDAPFQSLPRIALTAGLDKEPTFAPYFCASEVVVARSPAAARREA